MRDVSIQRVTNGWIVQDTDTSRVGVDSTFVYTSIEALQAALPGLLGVTSSFYPVTTPFIPGPGETGDWDPKPCVITCEGPKGNVGVCAAPGVDSAEF